MKMLIWGYVDEHLPAPGKLHRPQRPGDVGWDLESIAFSVIPPWQAVNVPTNIRVQLPHDCWGEIRARSSLVRAGLTVQSNTIDTYYTGELFAILFNMTNDPITIEPGKRIAQLVLHHAYRVPSWSGPSNFLHSEERGEAGFGSTGAVVSS